MTLHYTPSSISFDNPKSTINCTRDLRRWVSRFLYTTTVSGAPFSLYDTKAQTMRLSGGVLYHPNSNKNLPAAPTVWFNQTLHAIRAREEARRIGQDRPPLERWRVRLFVYWPTFLLQAGHAAVQPSLRSSANELLVLLYPLVEQYDRVLADMILRFRDNFLGSSTVGPHTNPLYFGIDGAEEDTRFATHLNALVANKEFRKYLYLTMRDSLDLAFAKSATEQLYHCPATFAGNRPRHQRGDLGCDACKGTRWTKNAMLLDTTALGSHVFQSRFKWKLHKPDNFKLYAKAWYRELEYILSARDASEGVAHVVPLNKRGELYLVNFEKLITDRRMYRIRSRKEDDLAKYVTPQKYYENERTTSILKEFDDRFPSDTWSAAHFAKTAFIDWAGRDVIASNRPKSLKELVTDAGWAWRDTLEQPYEVFYMGSLLKRHHLYDKTMESLVNISERKKVAALRKVGRGYVPRTADLSYQYKSGVTVVVSALQRMINDKLTTFYALPYGIASPEMEKLRQGNAYEIGGITYWTLHAINKHAQVVDGNNNIVYPDAHELGAWLSGIDAAMTKERFTQLRYEGNYCVRVEEFKQDKRKHIGPFTPQEDEVLTLFFQTRGKGRMQSSEWTKLLNDLPGRTRLGIRERLVFLGKAYAAQHGWAEYAKSPLCLKADLRRKEAWAKEGIIPRKERHVDVVTA